MFTSVWIFIGFEHFLIYVDLSAFGVFPIVLNLC